MSDATPPAASPSASPLPSDLEILAGGRRIVVRDRYGKQHDLKPLTMRDLVELEVRLGNVEKVWTSVLSVADRMFIVWLSLRKESKTDDEIKAGRYAMSLNEAQDLFDISCVHWLLKALTELFVVSGWVTREAIDKAEADVKAATEKPPDPKPADGVTATPAVG